MSFKGILFDYDGTLARTMHQHLKAWQAALGPFGVAIDQDAYYRLEGTTVRLLAAHFSKDIPGDLDEAAKQQRTREIIHAKEEHFIANYQFEFYPGVEELIASLNAKKVPIGIVTAGLSDRILRSTPSGFLDKFNAVVTGEHTAKGKPHPDPYLLGAKLLELDPRECIVIENAPLGVKAAKSAQAYCVAICSTLDESYFGEADEVVTEFGALKQAVKIKEMLEK